MEYKDSGSGIAGKDGILVGDSEDRIKAAFPKCMTSQKIHESLIGSSVLSVSSEVTYRVCLDRKGNFFTIPKCEKLGDEAKKSGKKLQPADYFNLCFAAEKGNITTIDFGDILTNVSKY